MTRASLVLIAAAGVAASAVVTVVLAQSNAPAPAAAANVSNEWPTFGHDPGGMRFSPLTQITPANAGQLQVAWTYHMKPAAPAAVAPPASDAQAQTQAATTGRFGGGGARFSISEVTPLVINGVMYISTPYGRVVALDPMTGKEVWVFTLPNGQPSTRGVEYFSGDAQTPPQIVFGTTNAKLYSIDAKTGKLNDAFGDHGVVNLDTPEILRGLPGSNGLSSPPIVYKNLIIIGGRTQENPAKGPAGDVRAWNVHDGKLVWTFHSIPGEGEKYNDTWAKDSWRNRTGVNVWGLMTVDAQRGIVYMPFGAPTVDQYGGDREGNNLFGSSLVAADANTGKYLWHFQVVHHDIWDADLSAPPALIDVKQGGRTIPAVALINKTGLLFLLDRVTGKPIYGVEERPVVQSEVPLERSSKTQVFPLKPPPLSRNTFAAADIATLTPELEAACRKLLEGVQVGGPYVPAGYNRLSLRFPGNHGGVDWAGVSFNPQLGYLFVNTTEQGQLNGLRDRAANATGPAQANGVGNRVLPDGPYDGFPGGGRFKAPNTPYNCQQPPWGQLTAVNVNTGEFAWRVPLGITESLPPGKQNTGRPGEGGTIATAGGLVFVGATDDARFRAFDAKTGKEVWTFKLGGAAQAVPATYLGRDGKQYVVIVSTGGGYFDAPVADDSIMAFALPARQQEERPVYRSETRFIEVDAVVTDKDGRFVPGLTADDFRVREAGLAQSISAFASIDLSTASVAGSARPVVFRPSMLNSDRVDFDRLYLIYLSPVEAQYLALAREQAKRFVTDYLTPRDVAAVWNGEFQRPLTFTNNKAELIKSIEPFMGMATGSGDRNVALGGLRAAIDWMTGIQGRRKSIVFFSAGFGGITPLAGSPPDTGDLQSALLGLSTLNSSHRRHTPEFTLADLVERSDVHVYACDVRGLAPAPVSSRPTGLTGAALASQIGAEYSQLSASIADLRAMADVTGGLAFVNRNDYERGFERLVDDNSRYYLLGYTSGSKLPRGYFRSIDVSVKRPGLRVRARQGYITR